MIIDLARFVEQEREYWEELERLLLRLHSRKRSRGLFRKRPDDDTANKQSALSLDESKRFHYLFQRACSDLAKVATFAAHPELHQYLESLVGRAYCQIHDVRRKPRFRPFHWLLVTLPCTFRKHYIAFLIATAITLFGTVFGAGALLVDARAKEVLVPSTMGYTTDPSERVRAEESRDAYQGSGSRGTAFYFTHNTSVSIKVMALGLTYGIGTILLLFHNGVILGAIGIDYIRTGNSVFLAGWLLPHGSVEIPAIVIAGQAGLVLAYALIGWGKRISLAQRLRESSKDVVTLIFGVALMLLWAGTIEAQFSQTHEPVIPYAFKITVGVLQIGILIWYFGFCGRNARLEDE